MAAQLPTEYVSSHLPQEELPTVLHVFRHMALLYAIFKVEVFTQCTQHYVTCSSKEGLVICASAAMAMMSSCALVLHQILPLFLHELNMIA